LLCKFFKFIIKEFLGSATCAKSIPHKPLTKKKLNPFAICAIKFKGFEYKNNYHLIQANYKFKNIMNTEYFL